MKRFQANTRKKEREAKSFQFEAKNVRTPLIGICCVVMLQTLQHKSFQNETKSLLNVAEKIKESFKSCWIFMKQNSIYVYALNDSQKNTETILFNVLSEAFFNLLFAFLLVSFACLNCFSHEKVWDKIKLS